MKWKMLPLLLAICFCLAGCGGSKDEVVSEVQNSATGTSEEEQAPYVLNFETVTVDGEALTSDCFAESKLTMLNVWATYCGPCLNEMPYLGEIAAAYDTGDFRIIGIISDVADDSGDEDLAYAKELIEQTQANYAHVLLSESLYRNLVGATTAVPTTFFVNQKGEILGYVVGALAKEDWEALINDLLEKNE